MKRTAVANILVAMALGIPAIVIGAAAISSPTLLARTMLAYQAEVSDAKDPLVAAAGSEDVRRHIQLTSSEEETPFPLSRPEKRLQVGDRITIASGNGAKQTYEVRSLRPLPSHSEKISDDLSSSPRVRLVLVTCRAVGVADARPLRLIIEDGHTPVLPIAGEAIHQQAL